MSNKFLKSWLITFSLLVLIGSLSLRNKQNFTKNIESENSIDFYHIQGIPDAPFLNPIIALPDLSGRLFLEWTEVLGATSYKLYRNTINITVVSGLTSIETTDQLGYTDLPPEDGIYYYAVTALNSTGESEISNVRSKNVILPDPTDGVGYHFILISSILGISVAIIVIYRKLEK